MLLPTCAAPGRGVGGQDGSSAEGPPGSGSFCPWELALTSVRGIGGKGPGGAEAAEWAEAPSREGASRRSPSPDAAAAHTRGCREPAASFARVLRGAPRPCAHLPFPCRFNAFHPDTHKPMHRECGFIRLEPDTNKVAFISAQNTGTPLRPRGPRPRTDPVGIFQGGKRQASARGSPGGGGPARLGGFPCHRSSLGTSAAAPPAGARGFPVGTGRSLCSWEVLCLEVGSTPRRPSP